ncbi:MAG: transcriptional regulator GcvA [Ectothiorhodospiraceae bacterium]|nr:transcriptional regulator GcvA [Ectothiorhodospiraceae bacterium]
MRHLPPLSAVRAFEAAARHLSFNLAARELHVTSSAISHQVRALETFLGVRLFQRSTRRVSLTDQGRSYLGSVSAALDQIDRATERVSRRGSSTLHLSVSATFATEWLVPRLLGFQSSHPDIDVRLMTTVGMPDFAGSDTDLGICFGHGEWRDLEAHLLVQEELVVVCSPQLARDEPGVRAPADLARVPLIHVLPRVAQWRDWLAAMGLGGVDAERGPRFHTTSLALEAAEAGLGVAVASRALAQPHLTAGRLVIPFESKVPSRGGYYLVHPSGAAERQPLVAFKEWILEVVRGEAAASGAVG